MKNYFFNSKKNIYPSSNDMGFYEAKKLHESVHKINVNILLNRIKINKKSEIKKNILLLIFSFLTISLLYIIL